MKKTILGCSLILMSSVATASVQTQTFDQDWLFDNSNPSGPNNSTRIQGGDSNGFGNYIEWTGEDGITVKVSAWSETAGSRSICDTDPAAPDCHCRTGTAYVPIRSAERRQTDSRQTGPQQTAVRGPAIFVARRPEAPARNVQ